MKVLSLWQPWASLWVIDGAKRFETRSWQTSYRGLVAVAATAKLDREAVYALSQSSHFSEAVRRMFDCPNYPGLEAFSEKRIPGVMPFGVIVGVVTVSGMYSTSKAMDMTYITHNGNPDEMLFGNYQPGRFAWDTSSRRKFSEPVPFKGSQGLRDLPPDIAEKVISQMK